MNKHHTGKRPRFFLASGTACLAGVLAVAAHQPAQAIVIYGGHLVDAPANDTAPVGFEEAWERVGANGNGTGVYLGNGFVITPAHVSIGSDLEIEGVLYDRIGSSTILKNPNNTDADLRLYRIAVPNDTPLFGLDPLPIAPTSLATFTGALQVDGILIGTGVGQTSLQPISVPGGTGFEWDEVGTRDKRWVESEIGAPNQIGAINSRTIDEGFTSKFQFFLGRDGAAAENDSGAGLFYDDNGVVTLAGLVHSVTQLDYTARNDLTYFSDLAEYADQIIITPNDLDGDGGVGQSDLDLILNRFGDNVQAGNWLLGDANGDGMVGIGDVDIILAHWGDGYGAPISAPAGVPEPASLVLLSGALLACSRRRRR